MLEALLAEAALLPYIAAGFLMIAQGSDGVYFVVPAFLVSLVSAILDAWVLLIEINR